MLLLLFKLKIQIKYFVIKIFFDDDYSNEAKDNGNKIYYKFVQYREESLQNGMKILLFLIVLIMDIMIIII